MLKRIGAEEGGEFKAVASGTLPSGKPVVINADGTVSVVEQTTTSFGSAAVFESASTNNIGSDYDTTNNKVVIAYRDNGNSGYGTAIVGTVSGTSISYGTPVVYNSGSSTYNDCAFDSSNGKMVISYIDVGNNERPTAIVGTVSGTSISFGTEVVASDVGGTYMTSVFDSNSNKIVLAYRSGNTGGAVVGTVSGTSISFGSEATFNSGVTVDPDMVFDSSNNKVVITYVDAGNSDTLTSVVGTVSGTSISFGSEVAISTDGSASAPASAFDTNENKVVVIYIESGTSYVPQAIIGTVSGTSISFTTKVAAATGADVLDKITFDPSTNKVVFPYKAVSTNYGTLKTATVSGSSITFSSATTFEAAAIDNTIGVVYDEDTTQVIIAYRDSDNSNYGTAIVSSIGSTNITSENYIGMSKGGAVADTKGATVDIIGAVNDEQSGLTAGQQYYVQTDGTIGTTADSPSVLAGTAISATELIVKE